MEKIKKNLPVILLSVMCTLLLVIVILLIVDNNTFKFSNSSSKSDTFENNTKESKQEENKDEDIKVEEETKEEVKKEESKPVEKKEEVKEEVVSKEEKNETNLLSYFDKESSLFTSSNNNESMASKLKDSFVGIVDFIFYDKEIKGYTFKELTNSAKLKVISIALAIDNKIDSYFPDYKEKIKDKYTSVKGTLALKYLEVTANFCSKNPDACNQAKIDFNNMKESFGFTWDLIKEMTKNGTSKIKDLYENWRSE